MILNLSLVLFFVDSILKTMQITTMKMEAKSKEAEANMDAARKLLNVTCDAYVHLTSDFKIKDPEKAFIELIAGSTEAQEVEKWSILDFISPPDRKRFCELANTQVDSAQSLSLQLLDTLGTAIEARCSDNKTGRLNSEHTVFCCNKNMFGWENGPKFDQKKLGMVGINRFFSPETSQKF